MKYNDEGARYINALLDRANPYLSASVADPEFQVLSPEAQQYVVAMLDGYGLRDLVRKHRPELDSGS